MILHRSCSGGAATYHLVNLVLDSNLYVCLFYMLQQCKPFGANHGRLFETLPVKQCMAASIPTQSIISRT